jgi:hypothetical protein
MITPSTSLYAAKCRLCRVTKRSTAIAIQLPHGSRNANEDGRRVNAARECIRRLEYSRKSHRKAHQELNTAA